MHCGQIDNAVRARASAFPYRCHLGSVGLDLAGMPKDQHG